MLRDLVGDDGCGDGNPLGNVANFLQHDPRREKYGTHIPRADRPRSYEGVIPEHPSFDHPHGRFDGPPGAVEAFFDSQDDFGGLSRFNPLSGFERSSGRFEEVVDSDVPPEVRDMHLNSLFRSFIHSTRSGEPMEFSDMAPPHHLGLSELDKEKISNRTSVMSRHFDLADAPSHTLESLHRNLHIGPDIMMGGREWASEFNRQDRGASAAAKGKGPRGGDAWEREFSRFSPARGGGAAAGQRWAREFSRERSGRAGSDWARDFSQRRAMEHAWNGPRAAAPRDESSSWRDEFHRIEHTLDEEGALARHLASRQSGAGESSLDRGELEDLARRIIAIEDPKLQQSNFVKLMRKLESGRAVVQGNDIVERDADQVGKEWAGDFEAMKDTLREDGDAASSILGGGGRGADWEDWVSEYDGFDPLSSAEGGFPGMWERAFAGLGSDGGFLGSIPAWSDYEWSAEENPFVDHPNPIKKAQELFDAGELSDAIHAFEAALRREPENSEWWRLLGMAHAENDRDDRAMSALGTSIEMDPNNLQATMALAVSCTNDSYKDHALRLLRTWIQRNPKYTHLGGDAAATGAKDWQEEFASDTYDYEALHAQVTDMFVEAARQNPSSIDPDVQIGMGLLFNLSHEYQMAVDCFRTALTIRQSDYLLWNKLGATLANSNRSEDALPAYYKALSIKPTYTRARANLGISYLNLENYEEAAKVFLHVLSIQPSATHIWLNLHTVFTRMNRDDLLNKTLKYDVNLFKDEFDF